RRGQPRPGQGRPRRPGPLRPRAVGNQVSPLAPRHPLPRTNHGSERAPGQESWPPCATWPSAPCAWPGATASPTPPDGPAGLWTGPSPPSACPTDLEPAVAQQLADAAGRREGHARPEEVQTLVDEIIGKADTFLIPACPDLVERSVERHQVRCLPVVQF